MLRHDIDLGERLFKLVEALMVRLLQEYFIRFIINNHLQVAQVQLRIPLDELVLEIAWHSHHDVALLLLASLSKHCSNLSLTRDHLNDLRDLSDQLARIGQDNDLRLHDARVHSHKTGNDKCASFTTTILSLEGEILRRVIQHVRNGKRLNDGRLEIVELGEACLDVLWHIQRIPVLFARCQILHIVLVLDLAHTMVDVGGRSGTGLLGVVSRSSSGRALWLSCIVVDG